MPEKEICLECWWTNDNIEHTGNSLWHQSCSLGLCPICNERAVVRYHRLERALAQLTEEEHPDGEED